MADQPKAYVYMLRCKNGSLYTGWTNDPQKRLAAHQSGRGARYTRAFGVQGMAYLQELPNRSEALKREAAIKKLTRQQKEKLAAGWAAEKQRRRCPSAGSSGTENREADCSPAHTETGPQDVLKDL